jgi:hypothetical protein
MLAFEPLVRIARTAFPYWLIAAALAAVVAAFAAKRSKHKSSLLVVVGECVGTFVGACTLLFIVLGCYVQLSGNRMSFVELLPSSLLVATGLSAATVISDRLKAEAGLGVLVAAFVFFTLGFGVFFAFFLSIFPKLMPIQLH